MRDYLAEDAEKGILGEITSTAQAALTVGVGAAFLYRAGGNSALSRGYSTSKSVLSKTKEEFSRLDTREGLGLKETLDIGRRALLGDDSFLRSSIEEVSSSPHRIRTESANNIVGGLTSAVTKASSAADQIIKKRFDKEEIIIPVAQELAGRIADDSLTRSRVSSFVEHTFYNLDNLMSITQKRNDLKLDNAINNEDVLKIIKNLQDKSSEKSSAYNKMQHQMKDLHQEIEAKVFSDEIDKMMKDKAALRKATGDRPLTIGEMLDRKDEFSGNIVSYRRKDVEGKTVSVQEEATEFLEYFRNRLPDAETADSFQNMPVDEMLRINKDGEIHNFTEARRDFDKFIDEFSNTMLGKIFKTKDFKDLSEQPSFYVSHSSIKNIDPVLARMSNREQSKDTMHVDNTYVSIYGRSYRVGDRGNLSHVEELDNAYLVGRSGALSRKIDQISENEAYKTTSGTKLFDKMNMAREGQPHFIDDLRSMASKFSNESWTGNVVGTASSSPMSFFKRIDEGRLLPEEEQLDAAIQLAEEMKVLNAFYARNTYAPTVDQAHRLSQNMSGKGKEFMDLLTLSDEDMIQELMRMRGSIVDDMDVLNADLNKSLISYMSDPTIAVRNSAVKENRGRVLGGTQEDSFYDLVRTELTKEAFLRHAKENANLENANEHLRVTEDNFMAIRELIDRSIVDKESVKDMNRLSDWAVTQSLGNQFSGSERGDLSASELLRSTERYFNTFVVGSNKEDDYLSGVVSNLKVAEREGISLFDTHYGEFRANPNLVEEKSRDDFVYMNKAVGIKDIIRDINDSTKAKSITKSYLKQWFAGRDNLEDVTTATMIPYFFTVRLSDALTKIGLGLPSEDKGSTLDLIKSITVNRAAPLIGAIYGYDYIDDMFGVATGQGLSATALSGFAHMDLGMRSIADATGMTELIQTEKDLNPILRYWTGDEFMGREEREDWYVDGYQEMRKARWWSFGGISEFRGSEIQYYQPNYLRRATSNWKDASLYDNVWDKWSHSLIPTPTNPLSPLVYMLDPYWLENRHAEDRPYPTTGKMFTEEAPWGPIMNATIGELIKPVRPMHTDRLNENYVDSKMLIERENQEIIERARQQEGGDLVRFKDGAIEAVTYTDLQAPTQNTQIVNISPYEGVSTPEVYGMHQGVTNVSDIPSDNPLVGGTDREGTGVIGGGGSSGEGIEVIEDLSIIDRAEISAASGDIGGMILSAAFSASGLGTIADINSSIKSRASENAAISSLGMPEGDGVITTESIYQARSKFGDSVLKDQEALADLRGLSSGDNFLGEMAYTSRFAAGIYGYGTFAAFPGKPTFALEDASKMTSPIRTFWDANLGGMGGGYLEIYRRFIPAFNHKLEIFNPLLNTQEDWLPEKFRFGDPYLFPKGEMRLPGRGYESIHELHPDEYGRYGAFDRFKILADVAPNTYEYKTWRDIAEKTVQDPELLDEMERIKDRVQEQSKSYDFFNYNFLGRSVNRDRVVVDEVLDNTRFTIVGSDETFSLAGVKHKGREEFALRDMLHSGSEVTLTTDKDSYKGENDDGTISAGVYMDGSYLNTDLVDEGIYSQIEDYSAAATLSQYTDFQILRGKAYEAISHTPVVYLSQKFFRIRDPLESWKQEMIYGTPYASWTRPIDSFLKPAIDRSLMSDGEMLFGVGAYYANQFIREKTDSPLARNIGTAIYGLGNRGAFIGGFFSLAMTRRGTALDRSMDAGAIMQGIGWAATRYDQPIEGTIGAGVIGGMIGNVFKKDVGVLKGAGVGSLVGLGITSMNTHSLDQDLREKWIPEKTREKWEIQEYFDRLEYIKYSGLYEKAARLAKKKEGVDIRELVDNYENAKEKNYELRNKLNDALDIVTRAYNPSDQRGTNLKREIEEKLEAIESHEFVVSAGEYGRSALMYKQAMDSTMYGLQDDASWSEIVRSIPQSEREHFLAFMKEKDPKEREKILRYVSSYTRKALQIAWGEEYDEIEDNEDYFKDKNLPGPFWSGWNPNTDLKDVEVKTIQNEGMLLSDFGHFESQLRDPDVINAPNISPDRRNSMLSSLVGIEATLKGYGLTGVDVRVNPTSRTGIQVTADIVNEAVDMPRKVANTFHGLIDS